MEITLQLSHKNRNSGLTVPRKRHIWPWRTFDLYHYNVTVTSFKQVKRNSVVMLATRSRRYSLAIAISFLIIPIVKRSSSLPPHYLISRINFYNVYGVALFVKKHDSGPVSDSNAYTLYTNLKFTWYIYIVKHITSFLVLFKCRKNTEILNISTLSTR